MSEERIPTKVMFDFIIVEDYLTSGRIYNVTKVCDRNALHGFMFEIMSDNDNLITCLQYGCFHLDNRNWTIVESKTK